MYQRILVCLDSSGQASAIASAAADLAVRYNAHMLLLCVHEAEETNNVPFSALSAQSVINEQSEMLIKRAREAEEIFKQRGTLYDVWHRTGNAVEIILQTASEQCTDVIVMGSGEPKNGWGWLKSSVGQQVARRSPCSLLQVADTSTQMPSNPIRISGLGHEDWGLLMQGE